MKMYQIVWVIVVYSDYLAIFQDLCWCKVIVVKHRPA